MGRAKVRKERRKLCRLAGRLGMTSQRLRSFYSGQQILVNEMQAQRIIHLQKSRPYLVEVEATFQMEDGKMVMVNDAYRVECSQPIKNEEAPRGPE